MSYNGWTNYETWVVALWLDNDEGTHETRREMGTQAIEDAPDHDNVPSIWTAQEAARFTYSDALKDWVTEMAPDLGGTLWADLLNSALDEVDWQEIAHNWLDDEDDFTALAEQSEEA